MNDLLVQIVLGGLLGLVGQGIRALIGLKKLQEEAAATGQSAEQLFVGSKLLISLFTGFVAGAVASLLVDKFSDQMSKPEDQKRLIALLIAGGYAGTDFLEGALSRLPVGPWTPAALPLPPTVASQRELLPVSPVLIRPLALSESSVDVHVERALEGSGEIVVTFGGISVEFDQQGHGKVSAPIGGTYALQWSVRGAQPSAAFTIAVTAPAQSVFSSGVLRASEAGRLSGVSLIAV